jgi:hypothetical protein
LRFETEAVWIFITWSLVSFYVSIHSLK